MKAIVIEKYGLPKEVLKIGQVPTPVPKENQVLVKIKATAINDYDWSFTLGKPYIYRLMFGLFKPKRRILGMELAGLIEGVGSNVKAFKVGDAVYGDISDHGFGTFAEYICMDENALAKKPDNLSFEDATAIPHAALLAIQALKNIGEIKDNQKVLINGGGGGVGTIGLQFAKLYNCNVTGVDSLEKHDMMKSMGFDFVIDYKKIDFTKNGEQYDLILDCKTNRSVFSYLKPLNKKGTYVSIGGKLSSLFGIFVLGKLLSFTSSKKLKILSLRPNIGLEDVVRLFEDGKIKCKIDGPYSLEEIPELIGYFGKGKHQGKIVVKVDKY